VIARVLADRWPSLLVVVGCVGLGASNWLRPPSSLAAAAAVASAV
jgi:hypothetical protein